MTNSNKIGQMLAEKTMEELKQADKPKACSRVWKDPEGYKYLVQWSNAVLLRFLIRKFTDGLNKAEYRRKAQVDDASRSMVRNMEEGYKRSTTGEYLKFVGFSQGSLEEIKGDTRELTEDGLLPSRPGSSLRDLGIDLGEFHQALLGNKGNYRRLKDIRGNYRNFNSPLTSSNHPLTSSKIPSDKIQSYQHITVLYPPLGKIKSQDLSYEIFIELINKTDYLLRKLVESLERKLNQGQKGYQVERMRIQSNLKGVFKGY